MSKTTIAPQKRIFIKHKKRIFITVAVLFIVVILPTVAMAYAGFVPGITELMKTNKPVDLGVQFSAADLNRLGDNNAFGITLGNFDGASSSTLPGSRLVVYGARTNEATMTQEELTAFVNSLHWTNSPLSSSQIRLSNGAIEFSGNVKAEYVSSLIKKFYQTGNNGQMSLLIKLAADLQNPAVYAKMSVSVDNVSQGPAHGRMHLKVLALKVDRMDLSSDVSKMNAVDVNIGEGSWAQGLPFSLGSLAVTDGQFHVYGTLPTNFAVGDGDPSVICNHYHGGSLLSLDSINGQIGSVVKTCE